MKLKAQIPQEHRTILDKILVNQTQQYRNRIIPHDQRRFIPDMHD